MLEMTTYRGPRKRGKEWDDVATTLISYSVYCRSPYGLPQSKPAHFGDPVKHDVQLRQSQVVMLRERAYFTLKQ